MVEGAHHYGFCNLKPIFAESRDIAFATRNRAGCDRLLKRLRKFHPLGDERLYQKDDPMRLALDLTKELLRADGTDLAKATRPVLDAAVRHSEAALLFIARNMPLYIRESARIAAARDTTEVA